MQMRTLIYLLVTLIFASVIITSSQAATTKTMRGFNLPTWWYNDLEKASVQTSLDNLKATGANWVVFAPFWYQNKFSSVTMRRTKNTASDAGLRTAIRYAQLIGFKVALKPVVDSKDGIWRGEFAPKDSATWFRNYRQFLKHYAKLARQEDVDYLIIGTEFATLSVPQYTTHWYNLIAVTRSLYNGSLTYAANWGERDTGEYYQIEFWDKLDAIGIDAYFPLATNASLTLADTIAAWRTLERNGTQHWYKDIRDLHRQFAKPVIFTEIGFLSCDGTGEQPWAYPCETALDLQEQADLYEGTLTFWEDKPWLKGYFFWRWDDDPNVLASNTDFMPQNKPAEEILKEFW